MTTYRVSVINHRASGVTVYEGADECAYTQCIKDTKETFDFLEFSTCQEIHSNKDGSVWLVEFIIFLE